MRLLSQTISQISLNKLVGCITNLITTNDTITNNKIITTRSNKPSFKNKVAAVKLVEEDKRLLNFKQSISSYYKVSNVYPNLN